LKELEELKNVWATGSDPKTSKYAFIMAHGRGMDVGDMQSLLPTIQPADTYCLIPQATLEIMPGRYAWYPHFWNENLSENMRYLNQSFELLDNCVQHLYNLGFRDDQIILIGHSQGANLMLEYFLTNPRPYKAVISMRGTVLGNYGDKRDFISTMPEETIVLLHAGRRDPYIPIIKTDQSLNTLKKLGANAVKVQYETGHGITRNELMDLKKLIKRDYILEERN